MINFQTRYFVHMNLFYSIVLLPGFLPPHPLPTQYLNVGSQDRSEFSQQVVEKLVLLPGFLLPNSFPSHTQELGVGVNRIHVVRRAAPALMIVRAGRYSVPWPKLRPGRLVTTEAAP